MAAPRGKLRQSPGEGRWSGGGSAGCARRGGLEAGTGGTRGGRWPAPFPAARGSLAPCLSFSAGDCPGTAAVSPELRAGAEGPSPPPSAPRKRAPRGPTGCERPHPPSRLHQKTQRPGCCGHRLTEHGRRQNRAPSPTGTGTAAWGARLPRAHSSTAPVPPSASSRVPWAHTAPSVLESFQLKA